MIDPSSDWLIGAAYSINDSGQIVGEGYNAGDIYFYKHAYLLTPVPEPSACVLVAIGSLALFGFAVRRRLEAASFSRGET